MQYLLLISPPSCPRTGSISDTDLVQQKRPQNAWTHFKHSDFCRFFSVQPLDCRTFPCWKCIKHSSDRKAVTCPSNQRTVVCDGDLSTSWSGEGKGARTGRTHQTSVHIMNLPLVLITYCYEALACIMTGNDYSAVLPFFPIRGSVSQFWLQRGKQTFLSLATFSHVSSLSPFQTWVTFVHICILVYKSKDGCWTSMVSNWGFKNISSWIILTLFNTQCLEWKALSGSNRQWFFFFFFF